MRLKTFLIKICRFRLKIQGFFLNIKVSVYDCLILQHLAHTSNELRSINDVNCLFAAFVRASASLRNNSKTIDQKLVQFGTKMCHVAPQK